jgi:superfamily II DNA or RNA helicase
MLDCCKTVKQVLLLTATPIVNTPFDLEILLSFLDGRDIGNKKDFTKEYFGKFNDTPFFEINKGDNIVINEDQLSLTKTFDTDQNWGIENNKIGKVPCKNDISIEIKVTPTKKPDEIKKYFSDRIIYYMVEDKSEYKSEDKSEFPKYNEKIYYIFWNTENDYNTYINKYLKNIKLIKKNREKEETNAFNAGENAYIWKTNIMLNSILNVIKTRESLSPELEIDEVKTDLEIDLKYKFNTTSYKYIIFCIFQDNIKLLYNFLSTYIEKTKIGIIRGDTSAEDRKKTADDYDKGNIKIIILSKAGEEGVDFKRTGVIMLADGVWTSAEYDQILGRAVRKNSNLRIKDNGDIDKEKEIDPNTLIPNKIECISILLTARFKEPTNDIVKYSGDLRQFKIILTKRAITNQVIKQIEPYFYKIIDKSKSTKKKDEEGINEEYYNNDGIKKKSTRRNSKSRRRSTRRNSKSRRRSTRRKSKSRRTTRRKSKSRRTTRRRSKSKKRSTRRKSKSRRRY